jgi:ethanolamine utilization protein EutQ (cupin superfamily)
MPVIKKFVNEDDESISMEIFTTHYQKIEFYLTNQNLNESISIDLNYEDIDLLIERLLEIKLELGQMLIKGGDNE